MNKTRNKKAFTLAETLITLTILGVIAAITVPGLVRRQVEAANRTKVKKAMRSYDLAINKMVVENGLKNDEALVNFAGDENNNCSGASNYFKISQGSGCVFKTSDGVWWDISDIQKTIIALNQNDLDTATADSDTNRAFYFVSWFDRNGTLRVNDLAADQGNDRLQALYDYIYGKTTTSKEEVAVQNQFCNCTGEGCCSSNCSGENVCVEKNIACKSVTTCVYDCYSIDNSDSCSGEIYYVNGNKYFVQKSGKTTYWTMSSEGDGVHGYVYNMFIYENDDGTYTFISNTGGSGSFINRITYDKDGNVIEFYNYDHDSTCTREYCDWEGNPFDQLETTYYGGNFEWEQYWDTGEMTFGSSDYASGGCGGKECDINISHKLIDEIIKKN